MLKADFVREVLTEARRYDWPKDDAGATYFFWEDVIKRRPELAYGCRCRTCTRGLPWKHVKGVLGRHGFGRPRGGGRPPNPK